MAIAALRSSTPLAPELPERLASAGIFVSVRGNSIRVSPHLYNSSEDVDRLVTVLAEALPLPHAP